MSDKSKSDDDHSINACYEKVLNVLSNETDQIKWGFIKGLTKKLNLDVDIEYFEEEHIVKFDKTGKLKYCEDEDEDEDDKEIEPKIESDFVKIGKAYINTKVWPECKNAKLK